MSRGGADPLSAAAVEAAAIELDAVVERIDEVHDAGSLRMVERAIASAIDAVTVDLTAIEARRALARCLALQLMRRRAAPRATMPEPADLV